jgi:hypothetical protein
VQLENAEKEYVPAGQYVQTDDDVAPAVVLYCPAEQKEVHDLAPNADEYLPAEHG